MLTPDLPSLFAVTQELIFKVEGFKFGWYLTFVQFVIYSFLATFDTIVVGEYARRCVFEKYLLISPLFADYRR